MNARNDTGSRGRSMARVWVPSGIVCFVLASLACTSPGKGKTAFTGATLFDGTGGEVVTDVVIIVANGKIEQVGPASQVTVPKGATEVSASGKWIIPGLIDAHIHAARWALPRYLAYGVTSGRDLGNQGDSVVALRDAISSGEIEGPRLYVSGEVIEGPGRSRAGATVVTSRDEARRAIGQRVLVNATQAKVGPRIDAALLTALIDEAKALQLPVAAHLGKVDALTATRAGVVSLEHMSGVVEATARNPRPLFRAHDDSIAGWATAERAWGELDSAALDRTARALVVTRVTLVPTLIQHTVVANYVDQSFATTLDLSAVPEAIRAAWDIPGLVRRAGWGPGDFAPFRRSRPNQQMFVRLFAAAGGTIAAGTDSPGPLLAPGASMHEELALLVAAGLTPKAALLAATRDAARLIRADSIGTVRNGGLADFVVLNGDPLADIANTRKIEMVVRNGVTYRPGDILRGSGN